MKKIVFLITIFTIITATVSFGDNYKFESIVRIDESGGITVKYDNGKTRYFDSKDKYIIEGKNDAELEIRTYNDGTIEKKYLYQLDYVADILNTKKQLWKGWKSEKIDGKRYINKIKYSETGEWIELPKEEYIEVTSYDDYRYLAQKYLENKYFPNGGLNELGQARIQATEESKRAKAESKEESRREKEESKEESRREKEESKAESRQAKEESKALKNKPKNDLKAAKLEIESVMKNEIIELIKKYDKHSSSEDQSKLIQVKVGNSGHIGAIPNSCMPSQTIIKITADECYSLMEEFTEICVDKLSEVRNLDWKSANLDIPRYNGIDKCLPIYAKLPSDNELADEFYERYWEIRSECTPRLDELKEKIR